jgi:hypothetical protein
MICPAVSFSSGCVPQSVPSTATTGRALSNPSRGLYEWSEASTAQKPIIAIVVILRFLVSDERGGKSHGC